MAESEAHTPHMVTTLAETLHLHHTRRVEFLSPTATQPNTGAIIQFDH
jgi:hypothetical protein